MLFLRKTGFWILLILANALLLWSSILMFDSSMEGLALSLIFLLFIVDFAFLHPKGYPYRYTLPALGLLLVLTVFPIYFTIKTAFTNYGTGHLLTRQQVIESLLKEYVTDENALPYDYRVFMRLENLHPTEDFLLLLERSDVFYLALKPSVKQRDSRGNVISASTSIVPFRNDQALIGDSTYTIIRSKQDPERILSVNMAGPTDARPYSFFFSFDDASTLPNQKYFISEVFAAYLEKADFLGPEEQVLRFGTRYGFRKLLESRKKYGLDTITVEQDGKVTQRVVFVNNLTNRPLEESDGFFYDTDKDGSRTIVGGYSSFVGLNNVFQMFTDSRLSIPFMKIFGWTLTWASLSVLFTFTVGLALALMLPCLTVIADVTGMLGGWAIGVTGLGINSHLYIAKSIDALVLKDIYTGLLKSFIFSILIALVSCHQGLSVSGGADAVGKATTQAVVISIVLIIVVDCLATAVIYYALPT